ncbi:hypothetical protein TMUPMC115_0461 [Tetragenococcus muriaticus PMC-11-5]|uniref:Uncharacterized protein n=1 Tax=Tetragenococcus muriaticus PMC-11-5 TaxID=1302649 RepID=A0A091C689_9ENTE|nr:hypothetical protein TMUPMC115_0461 [Tetragenococcus muriaticus PMC-11-5]
MLPFGRRMQFRGFVFAFAAFLNVAALGGSFVSQKGDASHE